MGARLSLSLNGVRNMCTLVANSLTPIADHFAERDLEIHALIDGREQELARERRIAKILSTANVPVSTSSCHQHSHVGSVEEVELEQEQCDCL